MTIRLCSLLLMMILLLSITVINDICFTNIDLPYAVTNTTAMLWNRNEVGLRIIKDAVTMPKITLVQSGRVILGITNKDDKISLLRKFSRYTYIAMMKQWHLLMMVRIILTDCGHMTTMHFLIVLLT